MNPIFNQEQLYQLVVQIQDTQERGEAGGKRWSHFVPNGLRFFEGLNFNIKKITAKSQEEPDTRPGWAPDWGTELFESMKFEDYTFKNCQFNWLNLTKSVFRNCVFLECSFEGTVCDEAHFENFRFESCCLNDSSFCKAQLTKGKFNHNQAHFATFTGAIFNHTLFDVNDWQGSTFFGTTLPLVTEDTKPLILISWDNKRPGLAAAKIVKKVQELGGVPFKFNYKDSDIDSEQLQKETEIIVKNIKGHQGEKSLPKQMLDYAKGGNFPEIAKIQKKAQTWTQVVSGVLFPGGQDIQPFFYEQECHPKTKLTNDLRRDLFEFAILDEVERAQVPFLGICRGMQILNIWRGGTLMQHVENHLYKVQEYVTEENAQGALASIFQTARPFVGYSFHHQAIEVLGKGLTLVARSSDKTIKAVEVLEGPFNAAIQWHPEFWGRNLSGKAEELSNQLSPGNEQIYASFIQASQKIS